MQHITNQHHYKGYRLLLAILTVVLLTWKAGSPTLAQDQTLIYGQPVSGEVSAENASFRYTFDGTADETIYISAYVPNRAVTLTIQLYGPNGTPLALAENNVTGTVIGPYTLPSTGQFILEVTQPEWERGITGQFELIVDRAELTPVKPDGKYSGTLPMEGALAFFSYTGPANELFGYAATGANLRLFIYAPDGTGIIYNEGEQNISQPLNILPAGGTYMAILQTVNPGGTAYELNLNPINAVKLEPDVPVSGQFSAAKPQVFRFSSSIDQLWNLSLTAPGAQYDNHLEIRSANDLAAVLVYDDGSGVDGSSRIDPFVTTIAGDYYVLLMTANYQPDAVYDYTLTLAPSSVVRLESGKTETGSVNSVTGNVTYLYFGIADERVRLTFETVSGDGQPGLILYSPFDELVVLTVRSQTRTSVEAVLPETGLYRLVIRNISYVPEATFDYTLMLERVEN